MDDDMNTKDEDLKKRLDEAGMRVYTGSKPHDKGARTDLVRITPDTPGYQLVYKLFYTAMERNMTLQEVADDSGLSASMLSHLRTGRRYASNLDMANIRAMAVFLGLPVMSTMILAEQVTPIDMYPSGEQSEIEKQIERGIWFMMKDDAWGSFLPKGIEQADKAWQLFAVLAYEQATGKKLLSGGIDYAALIEDMESFRAEFPTDD